MRLTRVRLRGFKSFSVKTELEFGRGVTAIVGPNGCGKSNVVDAVRWVIGEQNPRLLRGHRMHDLIFGGTETRPADSMAEVSLVLDNSDSLLPIPYQEIEITRRLFRDGESEYLINRNPCRLKDIAEMFMDTGVGTSAYSLMEQGRVDQIVSARPIDRRAVFEEAAGITKYKTKRDEAVRRLKRTEADLVRLGDIIGELEHQVRSLKRQAGIARRYRELKTELHGVEMTLLHREHGKIREGRDRLRAEQQALGHEIGELEARRSAVHADLEALRSETSLAESKMREGRERGIRLRARIEKHEVELASLRDREEDLARQKAQLEAELTETERRAGELSGIMAASAEREAAVIAELDAVRAQRDAVSADFSTARGHREEIEALLRQHRQDLIRLQNEVTGRENDQRELEREIYIAERNLERLQKEESQILAEQRPVSARLSAGRAARDDAEKETVGLGTRLAESTADRERQESLLDEQNQLIASLDRRVQAAQARLESLETLQRSYEGYESGTRFLIQRRDEDEMYGKIRATVAELVAVEPLYEKALEVALATELQSLVTDETDDAVRLLHILREQNQGRATFAILPAGNGDAEADAAAIPPGAVPALQVIHAEQAYCSLVQALFGNVLFVENAATARRCLDQGSSRWRVVTLEGEVFDPRGLIAGGGSAASGILTRAREIEESSKELAALLEDRNSKGRDRDTVQEDLSRRTAEICTLETALREKEVERATRNQEILGLEREEERLRRRQETVESELRTLRPAFDELRSLLATTETDLAAIRAAFDSCRQRMSASEEEVKQVHATVGSLQEQEQSLRLHVLEKEKDLERLRDTLESLRREEASLRAAQGERGRRIAELVERAREGTARREEITRDISRLYEEAEESERAVRRMEEELASMAAGLAEVERALASSESNLLACKTRGEEVERELFRLGVSAENLEHRAKQDHGAALEECAAAAASESRPTSELEALAAQVRDRIGRIGSVNELAIEECQQVEERYHFMKKEQEDLEGARRRLLRIIAEINRTTKARFEETFEQIRQNFQVVFRRVFGGGRADLILVTPEEGSDEDSGVEIVVQPPGKNLQSVTLLSGGEKAMTAITLLFAIYQTKPSPFCVLDEIDAPLDDANVARFCDLVRDFTSKSQFIVITHNKGTMEMADTLYGVTMQEKGISSLVSIEFDERGKPRAEAFLEKHPVEAEAESEAPRRPGRATVRRDGVEAVA